MANKTYISTNELRSRREKRQKERNQRDFLAFLRFLLILSFSGGVFWFFTLPYWIIKDSQQIHIEGNQLLSDNEIRNLIPLTYPQPLLKLDTENLAKDIEKIIPVTDVKILKQFLPPHLSIQLTEKKPIALAFAPQLSPQTKQVTNQLIGYLDEDGVFISHEMYENLKENKEELPSLKIIGFPQTYLAYWQEFYNLIQQSPVKILTIDWQNPTNLILHTEIGKIHLGGYSSKFPQQLMMLEKLETITSKIPREKIIYIDLTDPEIPSIKEKK